MDLAERLKHWIEASDRPMLVLAGLAVLLYLVELQGMWAVWGLEQPYLVAAVVIDVIFVADLLLKVGVLRGRYLKSPWFVIDLVSAIPALTWLGSATSSLDGIRIMRGFRIFRVLRALGTLRVMRMLRVMHVMGVETEDHREGSAFDRALTLAVLAYTLILLALVSFLARGPDEAVAASAEFNLVLGSLVGMALILVVVRYQIRDMSTRQLRALLNVALPPQVAEHFMVHPEAYDQAVRMPATVIFCDLVGFTSTVEGLSGDLEALKAHLEAAMDAIVHKHQDQDLIVDKFIGDAVMSFRGGPLVQGDPAEHARRVVRAALDTPRVLTELADPYFYEVKVGGASMEGAMIGAFGTSRRLSYTIIGDQVNVAARMEAACGKLGARNLFCRRTYELTRSEADLHWRRAGLIAVTGKADALEAFEVFDEDVPWLVTFDKAVAAFGERDFDGARALFEAVDAARTEGDGPSKVYMRQCQALADNPPPDGWKPVLQIGK